AENNLVGSGANGGQFVPAEDQNESFAPDAPELTASTLISETFGSESRMQVLTSSSTKDVITLEGLQAAIALEESVRAGEGAQYLIDRPQAPAITSFMTPALFALQGGAPMPTSDAEVKALYLAGLEGLPPEFLSFMAALVSDDASLENATAELGLTAITYETSDDFDVSAERATVIGDSVIIAPAPPTITNEPFSLELIFASDGDFQNEIARLFASAGLIILLALGIIFLVKPGDVKDRVLFYAGLALMAAGLAVAVAPSLALILPDVFPSAWADAALGTVLLTAVAFYAAAFLLWTFGSRRLRRTTADTLLTMLTIAFAIQWMNGYGFLRFEDQSQMVQILPILLIGLGVDYSIHMTTRYRQELTSGRDVDVAIGTAIRTVGVALVLATLTTAVGFLTNVTNDIPALAEFGELAAIGIVVSFVLMMTFVPAVREVLDRRAERHGRLSTEGLEAGESRLLPNLIGKTAVLPQKFAIGALVGSILVTGLGAYGMTGLSTEFSFLDFVPTTSPLRGTAVTLTERFDFPESTAVLVTGDITTGSAWNTMLESSANATEIPEVQSIETPDGKFATGNTLTTVLFRYINPGSELFDQELLGVALASGFADPGVFPPDADLNPLYDAAVAKYPVEMSAVIAQIDGGYDAALFNFDTTAGESGASQLAEDLNAAFEPSVAAGLAAVTTSGAIISDLIVVTLRDSQVSSLALTLGAALLLLVINFWFESRRPMLGLITTLPVAMVVIWVFGLMAAFKIPFGPVTATISALGIGIGIPYMIHVTHRYLEERLEWPDENEAIEHTLIHTGGALAGSAITTMAGFGILMISTTIPFRQFGFVLAYTILLALLAAVLVLPSMLVLWDRWHRKRGDAALDESVVRGALQDPG
ncbi:MAG: MMPL family transporter, partial [Proteobacteria bacterium]|nr:MMPL family transporter [Pseudomonadota bacterium]